jgi:putative molybdopterin biosynthesis protein
MGQSPAWVQHHIKSLLSAGLVELAELRFNGTVNEKYYRAVAGGLLLQQTILPETPLPVFLLAGSHDLALEWLAERIAPQVRLLSLPVGSLDGLIHLRQGLCQASGAHILAENGEYNLPTVRQLFPERNVTLVTLAHRTQGWIFAPGNPRGFRGAVDLLQPGIRFVNRNPGSGTRLWLDGELQRLGIPAEAVPGYERFVKTHTEAAACIQRGEADVALGLEAAALQAGLGFLPLFSERYDLVLPRQYLPSLAPVLNAVQGADFRRGVRGLRGYDTAHSGEEVRV